MKPGRARPPIAPQQIVAIFLALAVLLTQVYRAWAHCTLTVTANPAKVCVGEILTVTQSGVDCQGQSVNVTNTTSFGSAGQQIICPSPACGGCGIDNCATVMVVAVSGIVPTSATVCAGSSNTFSVTIAPPGETLPGDPDWTVTPAGAGSIIGSGTSVVFVAANTGVVATVTAGCGSSSAAATVTILTNLWGGWTVSNAPSISVTVSGEVASCAITTVTFTAAISTNNGLRYRSDMNGCAPTNEVSDLVLTNLVTTWNVTGPNAASGSGTQAMFTVSNPGTNMITFTTTGETLDPAGTYSTDAVATNVSYSLTLTPLDTNTCVHCTNVFVATAAPAGSGTFTWNPAGVVTYSPDGTTSSNAVVFTTAGLAQLVNVTYGACSQTATVNVFEVTGVAWEAINSPLTPNDHPSGTVGVKMFPDKNTPTDTVERRTVRVVATVNPPTNGIPIYFRVLDVDDPSADEAPVDQGDTTHGVGTGGDNRSDGTSTPVGGLLSASSALSYYSGSGVATASVVLTVSRQPGNNFRVAASCDPNALARLTVTNNVPDTLYVPGSDAAVSGFTGQITPLLTVWRRLHVEVDSMGSVVSNFVAGQITRMDGVNFEGVTSIVSSVNFKTGLGDASPNLDSTTPRNGRFENGNITVGPSQHFTADLLGNGNTRVAVKSNTYFNIGFILTKGTNSLLGRVVSLRQSPPRFVVKPTIPPGTFNGGSLDVAGHTFSVNSAGGQSIIVNAANPTLNFTLRDDDATSSTDIPDPDTSGIATVWQPAYVVPVYDTGTNTAAADFYMNSAFTIGALTNQLTDSRGSGLSLVDFWVILLKNGYQTDLVEDNDSNTEGTWRAAAVLPVEGVLLLEESIRDWITATNSPPGYGGNGIDPDNTGAPGRQLRRQEIINHKIGHLFGLVHADGDPTPTLPFGDVMAPSCCPPGFVRQSSWFGGVSLNKIRSKQKPGTGP